MATRVRARLDAFLARPVLLLIGLGMAGGSTALPAQSSLGGRYQSRGVMMDLSEGRAAFSGVGLTRSAARIRVAGDTVSIDGAAFGCFAGPGTYRSLVRGDQLSLELVSDPCPGRRAVLASVWGRVAPVLALTGATVIDGTGAEPRPGMTVVIRDGRIAAVHPDGAEPLPAGAQVRDLTGRWILPGLIDAHVHLATDPSDGDRRDRTERRLRNALLGGVVAVRDMGGDGRALNLLARDAAVGDIIAPVVRYSAILAGPEFFADPRVRASSAGVEIGTAAWARSIDSKTDLRQAMIEARGAGVTGVKLYAALDGSTAAKISREAKRQGLKVWSHVTLLPARPTELAAAGVEVLSHAPLLAWAAVAELPAYTSRAQIDTGIGPEHPAVSDALVRMRTRGVILEPTLWVYHIGAGVRDTAEARRRSDRARDFTRAAHRAGVRVAAGTDFIGTDVEGDLPNLHEELVLLVQAGLSPSEALVSATRINAELLGLEATHGTVSVGKAADLLVLEADPLADIRNTRQISFVVHRGVVRYRQ